MKQSETGGTGNSEDIVYRYKFIVPGTSGILTPFGKIKGLMFDDKPEPDTFLPQFLHDVRTKMKEDGVNYVCIDYGDNINLYYDILLHAEELLKEHFKLKITSKDQPEMILEHEEIEIRMDDDRNPSMIHARKPKS